MALGSALIAGCQNLPPPSQGTVNESLSGTGYGTGVSPQRMTALRTEVARTNTADLNGDGFVTLDEVVAMKQAGLTDDQMIARLRATGQVFELTPQQENYLRSQGVSSFVINQMESIKSQQRDRQLNTNPGSGAANPPGAVISVPPPEQPPQP
ncbi:MAG TPA: hypothetical protein VFB72_08880 [Verrucomicrobiae bacterium]|nr:hypothetical protein [Verrucomicrobiae bacterium]